MTDENAQKEYISVLDNILRTNPKKKVEKVLQKVAALKSTPPTSGSGDNDNTIFQQCIMSETIVCNQRCISQLHIVRDNLLSAFMNTTELSTKGKSVTELASRQLSQTVGNLISMVSEASSLSQRIHENAMGLHIATDFLRDPKKDLSILDFSKSGRIPISHFSCNEATSMCLTWLHTAAEKMVNEETVPSTQNNFVKIYNSFEQAMRELGNASQLVSQVFRILLYSNTKGKHILKEYVEDLKPQEINDIITELQCMRRQFDEISILLDRLGWSLADIWGRCTGKVITFEAIRKEGSVKLKNFEETEREHKSEKAAKSETEMKLLKPKVSKTKSKKDVQPGQTLAKKSQVDDESKKGKPIKKGQKQILKYVSKLENILGKRETLGFVGDHAVQSTEDEAKLSLSKISSKAVTSKKKIQKVKNIVTGK